LDGHIDVIDIVEANVCIFRGNDHPCRFSCDRTGDDLCSVTDLIKINERIFNPAAPGYCAPPPSLRIDPGIAPPTATLPDGRPLAALRNADGSRSLFVANEVVVSPHDQAELDAFVARTGGTVVADNAVPPPPPAITPRPGETAPTAFAVRIDPPPFDPSDFTAAAAQAGIAGETVVSSDTGSRLLAVVARELAAGVQTAPNFIFEGAYMTSSEEHPDGSGGFLDAFAITEYGSTGSKVNLLKAWQLVAAKPPPRRSRVAIIDGGFWLDSQGRPLVTTGSLSDLPAQPLQWDFEQNDPIADGQNPAQCTGGSTCRWHGNGAAGAAVGTLNNRYGAAGSGGQVADPILLKSHPDWFKSSAAIRTAVHWGADVISMSWGAECDNSFCDLGAEVAGLYPALRNAWANGVVMVAAAGNDGANTHSVPCRNDHVICIGALAKGANTAIWYSNHGPFVDLWAPTGISVMPDADNMTVHPFGGTSASAPFVAGIAAILRAYNPSLNSDDVDGILWSTAWHDSADPKVGAYVNAFAAVRQVAGTTPPEIRILSPAPNATVDILSLGGVEFRAETNDLEDGPGCCTVRWFSLKDGAMGEGATIRFQFPDLGFRLIRAEVEDSEGGTSFASLGINVVESPPDVVIDQPTFMESIYEDTPTVLAGRDLGLGLCSGNPASGRWASDGTGDYIPQPGCSVLATFHGIGVRLLTFTVTGPYGTPGQTSVWVQVVARPPTIARIIAPTNGSGINVDDCFDVLLEAYGEGTGSLTYTWTWQADQGGCAPFSVTAYCPISNPVCFVQPPQGITYLSYWNPCGPPEPPCIGTGKLRLEVRDTLNQTDTDEVSVTLTRNPH
jgi:hypothetical protein